MLVLSENILFPLLLNFKIYNLLTNISIMLHVVLKVILREEKLITKIAKNKRNWSAKLYCIRIYITSFSFHDDVQNLENVKILNEKNAEKIRK